MLVLPLCKTKTLCSPVSSSYAVSVVARFHLFPSSEMKSPCPLGPCDRAWGKGGKGNICPLITIPMLCSDSSMLLFPANAHLSCIVGIVSSLSTKKRMPYCSIVLYTADCANRAVRVRHECEMKRLFFCGSAKTLPDRR